MGEEEIKQRYKVFAVACREHNLVAEGAVAGFAVVGVPYGTVIQSMGIIGDVAETAGLVMVVDQDEDQDDE